MDIRVPAALTAALAAVALAQQQLPTGRETAFKSASEMDWKPSTNLPPGAEYHLVREDPATHGIQAVVKFPSGYAIPPHAHESDETLVVLRGRLRVRAGLVEKTLGASDYALLPAGVEHEIAVKGWGAAWALVTTSGPFSVKKP